MEPVTSGDLRFLEFSFQYAKVAAIGLVLVAVLTFKRVRKAWSFFPESGWKAVSLAFGFLGVLVATIAELPFMFLGKTGLAFLGLFVGPIEEASKLLPLKLLREEEWSAWKKTIGGAFFFGLIEGVFYSLKLLILGLWSLALLRALLVAFHVGLTMVAVNDYMLNNSLKGYAKASIYHSLYDFPLLFAAGTSYYRSYIVALGAGALLALAWELYQFNPSEIKKLRIIPEKRRLWDITRNRLSARGLRKGWELQ